MVPWATRRPSERDAAPREVTSVQRVHGLDIECAVSLPGIAGVEGGSADVELTFLAGLPPTSPDARLLYRSVPSPGDDDATVVIAQNPDGSTSFRYSDGMQADVYAEERPIRIAAVIAAAQTLDDFAAYLYGPILGFVLRTRGVLAMHASSVRIGDAGVLFPGVAGAGKSTIAAQFSIRGFPVISDDLTAMTPVPEGYHAHAAFDHVRLWSESEPLLFGRTNVLDRITPNWEKLRFPLTGVQVTREPTVVRAIYILDDGEDGRLSAGVHEVAPADALLSLTALTYTNYLLTAEQRAIELVQLGAVVRAVPVRRLVNRGAPLDVVCSLVEHDVRESPATAPEVA